MLKILILAIPLFAAEESPDKEFLNYLTAAEQTGDPEAQFQTAMRYANGVGTDINKSRAAYWLKRSAEQGHGPAQINLGIAYMTGTGVKVSKEDSYAWLYRAAQRGFTLARGLVVKLEAKMSEEEIAAARRKSNHLGPSSIFKGFSGYEIAFPSGYEALPRRGENGAAETVYFFPRGTPPSRLKEAYFLNESIVRLDVVPKAGENSVEAASTKNVQVVRVSVEGPDKIYRFTAGREDEMLKEMLKSLKFSAQ